MTKYIDPTGENTRRNGRLDDADTEGHRFHDFAADDAGTDTEGHARRTIIDDGADDAEGHARRTIIDDADDTEGHARRTVIDDDADDTEGHARRRP